MQETPQYQNSRYQEEEENVFQDLLSKYMPYWPLFVILVLLGGACAFTYLRYATPAYEITATVLIKDEKKGLDESKITEALDLFGSKKIVENEIEIIHSRTLAKQVVKDLHLYAPVSEKGRVHSRSAYTLSPIIVEVQNPDSLTEAKKVAFVFNAANHTITIEKNNFALNTWYESSYGKMRFLANPKYRPEDDTKNLYFSLVGVKKVAGDILKRLEAAASSKQSTVVNLTLKDEVPQRGEDILNDLITVYNKAAIQDKNILATNTMQFVEDRLKFVVGELDSVEHKLEQYKTRNKIVDISAQGQMFLESVGDNDKKTSELSMQLAVLSQVEKYVQSKDSKGAIVPSTLGVSDPVLAGLLERLYDAETQFTRLKETVAENNPLLVSLKETIEKLRPNILENIRNQRRSLEAGRSDIAQTNSKFASVLSSMPQKERELLEISRQQAIKNAIYTFLLQKREETALSYASTVADSRIVDNAEATEKPISPKAILIYLLAIAGAFGAGIGFVSVKEALNNSILFRAELEKYTAIPILGEVMKDSSKASLVIAEGKRTLIAEQFRHLRTSLGYLGINNRKKKILVTSTISGEGKSFVTTNLGVSLALMGKKVVLLELDLRKPKLSEMLGVSRATGISTYLIGGTEAEEIIKPTTANANLFLVPSGPIPPNPSELILNERLPELLAYLEGVFDYIIIDTAPVRPVTDAYILAPLCDATLYVVRHGHTPKAYMKKLDEQIKVNELKNIAIVFNGVKERGFSYGYGNGYGYGYGYGYSYTTEEAKPEKKKKGTVI